MSEGYETYRVLLRLYDGFSSAPDAAAPTFEYDHSQPGLQVLRRRYDLDRVAGEGDPLARSRRLCDWLHRHVRHFDTGEQIEQNCLSLLEYSFDSGREAGISCLVRGAAAVRLIVRAGMLSGSKGGRRIAPWEVSDG